LAAARAGGAVLREGFGKTHKFRLKSSRVDLVTEHDRRSEEVIIAVIKRRFPEHSILSEERAPVDTGSTYKWIIDPLDGTTNYTHNYPIFAISIALERAGEIVLGLVYSPILDELFLAERGRGATLNGKPIHVSRTAELSQALLATGFPCELERISLNLKYFADFIHRAQAVRRDGSSALDLSYLACGRFDGLWEMDLRPWDVAAGALIVREAGGRASGFSGGELDIYGNEILASNGLIHQEMVQVLEGRG